MLNTKPHNIMATSKSFKKHYIGGAKQIEKFGILKLSLPTDTLQSFIDDFSKDYNGREFLFLEVAPKKEADKNGNTHNVYVNEMIIEEVAEPATKKKSSKK